MMNDRDAEIYIHIPFCIRKCRYCDFLSFGSSEEERDKYITALLKEAYCRKEVFKDRNIRSVFIGGGTPTVLSSQCLYSVLDTVFKYFSLAENAEITVECNPGTADLENLKTLKDAGVNRLSIGAQSFDDAYLKLIGRIHDSKDIYNCFDNAVRAGFDNINIDLISALPGDGKSTFPQNAGSFQNDLLKAARLGCTHISAYSLILEEHTPLFDEKDSLLFPDEDTERDIYYLTEEVLSGYGYHKYEISNYAKKGFECIHNTGYWTGREYLGLGLGASSYYGNSRLKNTSVFKDYISGIWTDESETEYLSESDKMLEFIILGLRMTEGISAAEFMRRFHKDILTLYGTTIEKYVSMGLISAENGNYRFSKEGVSVSNTILADFL